AEADHAGPADAGPHRIAEPLESLRDQPAGAPLLEPQLGVLVQVAAGGDQTRAVDGGEVHDPLHVTRCTLHGGRTCNLSRVTCNAVAYSRTRTQPVDYAHLAFRPPRDAHACRASG